MKKALLIIVLALYSSFINAQVKEKAPFISGSLNTTFGVNQNYKFSDEDSGTLFEPKSVLIRAEVGYQFTKRWAASFNMGYDHHFLYNINTIPMYGSLKYHFSVYNPNFYFIETSFGRMYRPSDKFSDGDYYKIGFGSVLQESDRWSWLLRLDFHRKKIANFDNGRLDSISIGFGFHFF